MSPPHKRKGAKKPCRNAAALCAAAPLREKSSSILRDSEQFSKLGLKYSETETFAHFGRSNKCAALWSSGRGGRRQSGIFPLQRQ